MSTFDIEPQVEEYYGTYAGEPASEEATGWPEVWNTDIPEDDDSISPQQAFDMLFGYAEERHNNDPCASSVKN